MFNLSRALKRVLLLALLAAAFVPSVSVAQSFRLFSNGAVLVAGKGNTTVAVSPQARFTVDKEALAGLRQLSQVEIRDVPLLEGNVVRYVDLELREFSVLAPGAQIELTTSNGVVAGPLPRVKLYRGTVKGVAGSMAYVALGVNDVTGRISIPEGDFSIGYEVAGNDALSAVIVNVESIPESVAHGECLVTDDGRFAPYGITPAPVKSGKDGGQNRKQAAATVAAELAIECDFETYKHFGENEQAVIDWVTARLGAITTVYETEVGCAIQLSNMNVYKVKDSYPTVTSTSPLLDAFRTNWRQNKGSVKRTMAHLISRQPFDNPNYSSGLAGLGVLCSKDYGYGVTRVMASQQFPTIDESVIAHELGHNFGSNHTHNCQQWGIAIDSCVTAEDGTCFTAPKQVKGTIMSYCNNKSFSFGSRVQDFLIGVVDATECLVPISGGGGGITVSTNAITIAGVKRDESKDTTLIGYFKNTGTKPFMVLSAEISGSSDVQIVSPSFPLSLAAKQSGNLQIRYSANTETPQTATISFMMEGDESSATLLVTGTTAGGGGGNNKPLSFSAGSNQLAWGTKRVGSTNDTIIRVQNMTAASISTTQPKWDPTSPTGFTIIGTQLLTIAPGGTGEFKLRFNPPANKSYSAKLIIPFGSGQDTLLLSGVGSFNPDAGVRSLAEMGVDVLTHPNPFNSAVGVKVSLPSELVGRSLLVEVFNVLGVSVAKLYDQKVSSPSLELDWKPADLDAGTYYVVTRVDDAVLTRKIIYKH